MKRHRRYDIIRFLLAFVAIVSFTACEETERPKATVEINLPFDQSMRVNGSGASFPAPLYQAWFRNLSLKEPRLQFNFQSVGSGAGIERFTTGVVDFAASDIGMTDQQIAKINRGVVLLPMTAGSLVLAYNLPGVKNLKLTRQTYVDIFLGKITKWNDPKIAKSNPGVKLPNQNITVVHRSDGSGTTAVFTKHLGQISPEWKKKVGVGTAVQWPSGAGKTFIAGRGNDGVTGLVVQTPGAIGYIEYSFATQNNLNMAALQNKAGNFVAPNNKSGSATLAQVELPDNLLAFITDPPGADSYPIVTYTWMLLYKKYDNPNQAIAMEAMVQYCLTDGQKLSPQLGYVQLPPNVVKKVAAAADKLSPDFKINIPQ